MSNSFDEKAKQGDYYAAQLKTFFEGYGKDNWFQDNYYPGNAIISQHPGFNSKPDYKSVEKESAWQRLYDVDWIVSDGNGQRQTHEVKWSGATHDKQKQTIYNPTQNIFIETVSSKQRYDGKTFNTDWVENPKTGKKEKILRGVGWYRKREKVLRQEADGTEHIITDENDMADWFHFYCTIYPEKQLTATRDEIKAFKADPNIPDGALLLTKFPIDYCISIKGRHLQQMVDEFKNTKGREVPIWDRNNGNEGPSKGYLIPVGEVVPASVYGQSGGKTLSAKKTARFYDPVSVKVNFIWNDNWVWHGSGIPYPYYTLRRFRDALGAVQAQGATIQDGNGNVNMNLGEGTVTVYKQKNRKTGEVTFADGSQTAKAAEALQSGFRHDIEIPQFQLDWLLGFTNKFEVK